MTTTGPGETVVQTAGGTRLAVDCKANPLALVRHVKRTFIAECKIVNCGLSSDPNERLNTVP